MYVTFFFFTLLYTPFPFPSYLLEYLDLTLSCTFVHIFFTHGKLHLIVIYIMTCSLKYRFNNNYWMEGV